MVTCFGEISFKGHKRPINIRIVKISLAQKRSICVIGQRHYIRRRYPNWMYLRIAGSWQ